MHVSLIEPSLVKNLVTAANHVALTAHWIGSLILDWPFDQVVCVISTVAATYLKFPTVDLNAASLEGIKKRFAFKASGSKVMALDSLDINPNTDDNPLYIWSETLGALSKTLPPPKCLASLSVCLASIYLLIWIA